ncbi:MAG: thiamine pyrophosphate-binding protein [Limnochordia bacterium]|jgi:acetolactate synthase-1/2/3 large subunit
MTVAQIIAKTLAAWQITHVFGLPGGSNLGLVEALRQEGITFVLTKHENSAALMASTYARLTGSVGVCLATGGPGAINMINGVAHSLQDREPILILTGQFPEDTLPLIPHQRLDHGQFFRPVTKWSTTCTSANVGRVVEKALKIALSQRPGPVHIDLPANISKMEASGIPQPWEVPLWAPTQEALEGARRLLKEGKKPLVLAGLNVLGARDAFLAFVEKLGAPVLLTPKAKGLLPADHPCLAGIAGLGMAVDKFLLPLFQEADLLITIGYDPIEVVPSWYRIGEVPVLHIDGVANVDGFYTEGTEVIGSIEITLESLLPELEERSWGSRVEELKDEVAKQLQGAVPKDLQGVSPSGFLRALGEAIPANTIVTCDTGAHKMLSCQYLPLRGGKFLVSNGISTMGYSLPAAIAARHLCDDPILCLTGDGGLGMVLGELETAARAPKGFPIVVFCDSSLSLIKIKQHQGDYHPTGVDFGSIDWQAAAQMVGARGLMTDDLEEACQAVVESMESGELTVIGLQIDPREYYQLI